MPPKLDSAAEQSGKSSAHVYRTRPTARRPRGPARSGDPADRCAMAMICLVSAKNSLETDVIAEVAHNLEVGAELLGRRNLPGGYSRSGYMRDIRELQTAIDRQLNRPAPPARTVATSRRLTVVPGEAAHAG